MTVDHPSVVPTICRMLHVLIEMLFLNKLGLTAITVPRKSLFKEGLINIKKEGDVFV